MSDHQKFIKDNSVFQLLLMDKNCREEFLNPSVLIECAGALSQCRKCPYIKNEEYKLCRMDCVLKTMGLDFEADSFLGTVEIISYISEFLLQAVENIKELASMRDYLEEKEMSLLRLEEYLNLEQENLLNEKLKVDKGKEKIIEGTRNIENKRKEVIELKEHIGRKSNYKERKKLLEKHWLNAEPKPTINELMDILGVSRRTVLRDLKRFKEEIDEIENLKLENILGDNNLSSAEELPEQIIVEP